MSQKKINAPKGTRDLYPEDLLRQQYITNAWRDAAIRCGFDEIAGPTFETTELYAVKSGEGILGELFQAFSGKSPKEVERVKETGQAEFALRPEFTPTLARMYAAKAKELPQPCKWFTAGPYFRAERPQRGRLREFLQWNCDVVGLPNSTGDAIDECASTNAELIGVMGHLLESLGLQTRDLKIRLSFRPLITELLQLAGVHVSQLDSAYALLDKRNKLPTDVFAEQANSLGLNVKIFDFHVESQSSALTEGFSQFNYSSEQGRTVHLDMDEALGTIVHSRLSGIDKWLEVDMSIVRGLAYYTGMVFEAIADGERAVAGGGRYDNLIELFGGPPTPACGFGMGDVVLGNILDDKGLMPSGAELMDAVSRPQASIRPVAFVVVPNKDEENHKAAHKLIADLRRGVECEKWKTRQDRKPWDRDRYAIAPMHARLSYKSTSNPGKLKADANRQHARYFVEIHGPDRVELRDLDAHDAHTSKVGSFNVDPTSPHYVGARLNRGCNSTLGATTRGFAAQ